MRERITLVHPGETSGFDSDAVKAQSGGLSSPNFQTAREDRLTIPLDQLPPEVRKVIRHFSDLNLRWTSPWAFETLNPFASRLSSPGLHVAYTPVSANENSHVCFLLRVFGSYDCKSLEATHTASDDTTNTPEYLLFQELEDLKQLTQELQFKICPEIDSVCQARAQDLLTASSLELTYDATSQNVKLFAFWPLREQRVSIGFDPTRRTEVGIFSEGSVLDPEPYNLGLSGSLTVLGDQAKPSYTSFQFPSRHRLSEAHFSSKFLTPTGLHPTLQLSLSSNEAPSENGDCKPFAYFTLPKTIFADRYQLDDNLFMASKNLTALKYMSSPVDLEAPAYTTRTWGSNILLELAPKKSEKAQAWTAEVPLHLRYLEPSATGAREIEVPYPAVFWACSTDQHVNFSNNPWDRTSLGYDTGFSKTTVFWHIKPQPEVGNRLLNPITVPVLRQGDTTGWVSFGTTSVIALGFMWILWKLASAFTVSANKKSLHHIKSEIKKKS